MAVCLRDVLLACKRHRALWNSNVTGLVVAEVFTVPSGGYGGVIWGGGGMGCDLLSCPALLCIVLHDALMCRFRGLAEMFFSPDFLMKLLGDFVGCSC